MTEREDGRENRRTEDEERENVSRVLFNDAIRTVQFYWF
jgi:hypothetical protein